MAQGRARTRQELVGLINGLFPPQMFPPQMFAAWSVHGNADWTPQKVVWVSLIMNWLPGHTLQERFCAARRVVRCLRPHWKLPSSCHGFVDAQLQWGLLLHAALLEKLRPDESCGAAWRVASWLVLAVDGSRFECPRTTANELGLKCAGKEKTGPQIFQTTLQHVGSGLPWDFRLSLAAETAKPPANHAA